MKDGVKEEKKIIEYEKIWDIGKGLKKKVKDVSEEKELMSEKLIESLGEKGENMRIIYGG